MLFAQMLLAQWQPTQGPYGGSIREVKWMDGNNILAGTDWGGIYASTDGGQHWKLASEGIEEYLIHKFAKLGQYYYAASFENVYRASSVEGPWTRVTPSLSGSSCSIYELISTSNALYMCACENVYRSVDDGMTWEQINTTNLPVTISLIHIHDGVMYGSLSNEGVFSSSDGGVTWIPISNSLPLSTVSALEVNSQYVFIGTIQGGMYRLGAGESDWTQVITGFENWTTTYNLTSKGDTLLMGNSAGLYMSIDNGDNWIAMTPDIDNVHGIATNGSSIAIGTTYNGMALSSDLGDTWTISNEGLTNTLVTGLAKRGADFIASTNRSGVYSTSDNGGVWEEVNQGLPSSRIARLMVHDSTPYVAIDGTGVFRLNTDDNQWEMVNAGLTNLDLRSLGYSNNRIFVGTGGAGLFKSDNNGDSWGISNTGLSNQYVSALANDGNTVYAGTGHGVFKSENNGSTWTAANAGISSSSVFSLLIKDSKIFVGTVFSGIKYSADSGATWIDINEGLPKVPGVVRSLVSYGDYIYAVVTGFGVYMSNDNGASWTSISDGLPIASPGVLLIDGDYIYVGTMGNGVWKRPLSEVTSTKEPNKKTTLLPIYPNPAINTLTIDFPEDATGKIFKITNVFGVQVHSGRIQGVRQALSITNLPPGMYLLQIPGTNATGKFIKQ